MTDNKKMSNEKKQVSVKLADMPIEVSLKIFEMINPELVKVIKNDEWVNRFMILTDENPKNLVYPDGWYYDKGKFTNKGMTSTGIYQEARFGTTLGQYW